MRTVWLIVRREFLNRVRTRAFVVGTLFLVVIIGGYLVFFTVIGARSDRNTLGLTPATASLAQTLGAAAQTSGRQLDIREVDGPTGERLVREGELDALLTGEPGSYALVGKDEVSPTLRGIVQSAVAADVEASALRAAGVDPAAVAARAEVTVRTLDPPAVDFGARTAVGLVSAGLLYLAILIYGNTVAQGVVEEKSSRVIELLLATVKPGQLMLGKIIGVGGAGLAQFLLLGVLVLVGVSVTGAIALPAATTATVLGALVWFVLGFFLYATLYAAAGSMVSRSEDLQAVVTPITILVVAPFIIAFTVIDEPTAPAVVVLSLVPFFAPILMPVLIALGAASAWQVSAAAAATVVTIGLLALLAGRIYANSVLRTGARVTLRQAFGRAA